MKKVSKNFETISGLANIIGNKKQTKVRVLFSEKSKGKHEISKKNLPDNFNFDFLPPADRDWETKP